MKTYAFETAYSETVTINACGKYTNGCKDITVEYGDYYEEFIETDDADEILDALKGEGVVFANAYAAIFARKMIQGYLIDEDTTEAECLEYVNALNLDEAEAKAYDLDLEFVRVDETPILQISREYDGYQLKVGERVEQYRSALDMEGMLLALGFDGYAADHEVEWETAEWPDGTWLCATARRLAKDGSPVEVDGDGRETDDSIRNRVSDLFGYEPEDIRLMEGSFRKNVCESVSFTVNGRGLFTDFTSVVPAPQFDE